MRKIFSLMITSIIIILVGSKIFYAVPETSAQSNVTLSAALTKSVTVDGVISSGEWSDADHISAYIEDVPGTFYRKILVLYVKNDADYLYIAAQVDDFYASFWDGINFYMYFDNDNDGKSELGDDVLNIYYDGSGIWDNYIVKIGSHANDQQQDIEGAINHTSPFVGDWGTYTMEIKHPFNSGEFSDISLSIGDTVGFMFAMGTINATTQEWMEFNWPSVLASEWAKIVIAKVSQPPTGSIEINENTNSTISPQVALKLSAVDDGSVQKMCFSNDGINWSDWEPYLTSKIWNLTENEGVKVVYVKFQDDLGLVSYVYSDSIFLVSNGVDTTPPSGSIVINNGAPSVGSKDVTLYLYAQDLESGVSKMRFRNQDQNWTDWEMYSSHKNWRLAEGNGEKIVYVQFENGIGLISEVYNDTISLAVVNPWVFPVCGLIILSMSILGLILLRRKYPSHFRFLGKANKDKEETHPIREGEEMDTQEVLALHEIVKDIDGFLVSIKKMDQTKQVFGIADQVVATLRTDAESIKDDINNSIIELKKIESRRGTYKQTGMDSMDYDKYWNTIRATVKRYSGVFLPTYHLAVMALIDKKSQVESEAEKKRAQGQKVPSKEEIKKKFASASKEAKAATKMKDKLKGAYTSGSQFLKDAKPYIKKILGAAKLVHDFVEPFL
jgi:hypothetical protein